METTYKRNALIILALAIAFHQFFMFLKHNSATRNVIPFGDDPYDAVGSFAVVIGMMSALIAVFRAFRPYGAMGATPAQRTYTVRAQLAVVFCILVTLLADAVALIRHLPMWASAESRDLIIMLFCLMTAVTAAVLWVVLSETVLTKRPPTFWPVPLAATMVIAVNLGVYPEKLIQHTVTHLLTVVIGAILLFAPVRQLLLAIVPSGKEVDSGPDVPQYSSGKFGWALATSGGVLLGAFFFLAEMTEPGANSLQLYHVAFVAGIFVTLATAGLLIAYAFLAEPLGL